MFPWAHLLIVASALALACAVLVVLVVLWSAYVLTSELEAPPYWEE